MVSPFKSKDSDHNKPNGVQVFLEDDKIEEQKALKELKIDQIDPYDAPSISSLSDEAYEISVIKESDLTLSGSKEALSLSELRLQVSINYPPALPSIMSGHNKFIFALRFHSQSEGKMVLYPFDNFSDGHITICFDTRAGPCHLKHLKDYEGIRCEVVVSITGGVSWVHIGDVVIGKSPDPSEEAKPDESSSEPESGPIVATHKEVEIVTKTSEEVHNLLDKFTKHIMKEFRDSSTIDNWTHERAANELMSIRKQLSKPIDQLKQDGNPNLAKRLEDFREHLNYLEACWDEDSSEEERAKALKIFNKKYPDEDTITHLVKQLNRNIDNFTQNLLIEEQTTKEESNSEKVVSKDNSFTKKETALKRSLSNALKRKKNLPKHQNHRGY